MDDQKAPEMDEVHEPVVPLPAKLDIVPLAVAVDEHPGDLDFEIMGIQPRTSVEMGPGAKGKLIPYWSYGWGAVMSPQTAILGKDGKKMAILVPLPPGGMIKMSDLKRNANKIWREARQRQMDD